jgi:ribosomal protein S18 acetylase RimI-like enzyme
MAPADIDAAMRLKEAAGWNQSRADWEMFLALSPAGCRVAVHDGAVIGTVTALVFGGRSAWIAMLLVDPAFRGMGVGRRLVTCAVEGAASCPTVRLDATPAGEPLYRGLGFRPGLRIRRYAADRVGPADNGPPAAVPIREADMGAIAALDASVFGADRRGMLDRLLARRPDLALAVPADDRPAGYAFGRSGSGFHQIGPVAGSDPSSALAALRSVLTVLAGERAVIDVPCDRPESAALLEAAGFREQRSFLRMTLREADSPARGATVELATAGADLG